jgi:CBS domain-containing protein
MKVSDIMHRGVKWVTPETPVVELAKRMLDEDVGAIPVRHEGEIIGIVTDRDITLRAVASGRDLSSLMARDVMTRDVNWCHDSENVKDAVELMERKHIRRLPVLDDRDRLVGMLSLGDISGTAPRKLTAELMQSVSAHHV